jgi:tetratricopeptide (TPR) repeat protein
MPLVELIISSKFESHRFAPTSALLLGSVKIIVLTLSFAGFALIKAQAVNSVIFSETQTSQVSTSTEKLCDFRPIAVVASSDSKYYWRASEQLIAFYKDGELSIDGPEELDEQDVNVGEGFACIDLKRYHKAIIEFSEAISNNGSNAQAYWGRALAFQQLKKYDLAVQDCTKAMELRPNASHFRLYRITRGQCYRLLRDFTHAETDLKDAGTQLEFAYNYLCWGKYDQAKTAYDKYMNIVGDNDFLAHYRRAMAELGLGQKEPALSDLKIAQQHFSLSPQYKPYKFAINRLINRITKMKNVSARQIILLGD